MLLSNHIAEQPYVTRQCVTTGNHITIGNYVYTEKGLYQIQYFHYHFERYISVSGVKWLVVSLLFCFCSVLSKEQGITAVAVCFTYDVFITQKVTGMYLLVWVAVEC